MKLSIERDRLIKPLNLVVGVVERKQTLPILANVYLKRSKGQLELIGTDLEIEMRYTMDNVDGEDGECTVTARKLLDICRALPDSAVISISIVKDKAVISSGKSKFSLQTLPAEDFPRLQTEVWQNKVELKQEDFKSLLENTAFSMAHQDVRYYLNGLMLELGSNALLAVATDGHRLAKSQISIPSEITEAQQVIVPRKAVMEMTRILSEEEGQISLEINPRHIRMETGALVFTTKLIDGKFPDYHDVMKPNLDILLQVDRVTFLDILNRVAILTNDKFRGVRLSLQNGVLQLIAHNPEQEEASDEMSVEYSGKSVEIGFNVSYLLDALRALESESVELRLKDQNSSCTINTPDNEETRYLIMPMRI